MFGVFITQMDYKKRAWTEYNGKGGWSVCMCVCAKERERERGKARTGIFFFLRYMPVVK